MKVTKIHVVFKITLPLIAQERFDLYRMIPIPNVVNDTMAEIKPCNRFLGINAHRDQYVSMSQTDLNACMVMKANMYLCSNNQIIHSRGSEVCSCEVRLFANDSQPDCSLNEIEGNSTWIQMNHKNEWIYALRFAARFTAVCDDKILQLSLQGSGILKLQPTCILKHSFTTIYGHETVVSTAQSSYLSLGKTTDIIQINQIQPKLHNINTEHYNTQLSNLTAIQRQMSTRVWDLPSTIQTMDVHHTAVGYSALALSVAAIIYLIWKHKSRKHACNATPPQALPRTRIQDPEAEFSTTF